MKIPKYCDVCDKPARKFYSYFQGDLIEVDYSRHPIGLRACKKCQDKYLKNHIFYCLDCGQKLFIRHPVFQRIERCNSCDSAYSGLYSNRLRASHRGLSANLNSKTWVATLTRFNKKCAYCGGDFEVLEHFTPIKKGGGTDDNNCLPACRMCNSKKNVLDGRSQKQEISSRLSIPLERLSALHEYLDSLV